MRTRVHSTYNFGYVEFFRTRLLISDSDRINQIIEGMDKECNNIRHEALRMSWYMRGGITLDETFALTLEDRELIADLVKENLETTKKSGMPFF